MENKKLFKLTNPQKSIWYTGQFYSGTTVNNICTSGTIYEKIDENLLKKAINNVVKQNDSFRIHVVLENNIAKQYIADYKEFNIDVEYINDESEIERVEKEEVKYKFNVIDSDLFKFKLAISKDKFACVILTVNHLIADSWSMGITIQEILRNYHCLKNNEESGIETFSYIDYINSEEEYKSSKKFENDKNYWNEIFETIPEQATIPSLKNNIKDLSYNAKRLSFEINKEILSKINDFCRENNISTFNFFMAIFSIYIGRVSNIDDFVIGTPILNRSNFKEKRTTGMFVNTVPVRVSNLNNGSFKELSSDFAKKMMGILRHQKYSYNSVLEDLRAKNENVPNLYNIIISYQITKAFDEKFGNYKTNWTFNNYCANDFNIHIYDINDTGDLIINYDYLIDKYSDEDVTDVHNRIINMINQVLENNEISSSDIEIVTPEEKDKILNVFNNTKVDYPKDKTIVDLFEEQAQKTPDNIAVVFEDKKLTYRELNEKANSLARRMIENNVKRQDIIGIMLNRSLEMIIGILAIQKSGATYLPIDPEYPSDRISYMIENSELSLILTNTKTQDYLNSIVREKNIKTIDIEDANIYSSRNNKNVAIKNNSNALAYLIYTSGSTGNPKGVKVTNINLVNFVYGMKRIIDFTENKTMLSVTTMCFDIFGLELWCSLTSGMTLIVANEEEQNTPALLNKLCLKHNVNIIQTTPSRYSVIFEDKNNLKFLENITELLVGGEALNEKLFLKIKKNYRSKIFNMYGPTETTIWSTVKDLTNTDLITIGKPIANTQCYILDKNKKLLPPNVIGELYIGGDSVSNGYLKRNDLNKEQFILSPFSNNKKLYNTNDLAYLTKNGEIMHLGRTDFQVKIRGFRVELGEIENIIENNKNVNQSVVLKKNLKNGRDTLVAYYTAKTDIEITNTLKNTLMQELPKYMIPQYFIKISEIPYTPNGKIDRNALLNLDIKEVERNIVKPRNTIDEDLIYIVSQLLQLEQVGINDTLLDLGGDSLTAITLSAKILAKYNIQINIRDLLSKYTIKDISDFIQSNNKLENSNIIKIEKAPIQETYPLSSAQKRIYYNSKMIGEDNTVYNMPGGFFINDLLEKNKVKNVFKQIIQRHSSLRTNFILKDNEVVQKINNSIEFEIPTYQNTENQIEEIKLNFVKPFNLEKDILLRVELHYIDNQKTLLLFDSHHIVMDGTSLSNLITEFSHLYNEKKLESLPIEYKDYAFWENNYNESTEILNIEKYWLDKFKGCDFPQLNLPYDYKFKNSRSYNGNKITKALDKNEFTQIELFARKLGVSPYTLFLSAFFILLYKYTNQDEIILGSPIANRDTNGTENLIGMFVNNILIKENINSEESFQEFLNKLNHQILSDLSNQPYPFDKLIKKLNIKNDNTRNPLFDVMFTYQNEENIVLNLNNKNIGLIEINNNISKFNLSIEIKPKSHTINLEYCTDLFKKQTIERLFDHYMNVIKCIMANNDIRIKDISIVSEYEKNKILYEFNNMKSIYPNDKTVIQLFEEQVRKNPNNIAVKYKKDKITYSDLNRKANFLANKLMKNGICSGDVIGIYLNRSIELIIAMIATLKIGAIYMPMYINYPKERLEYMLQNSKAKLLISNEINVLDFDILQEKINSYKMIPEEDLINKKDLLTSEDIVYIIYTSGSTGKPKGVQILNKNLINYIFAFKQYFNNKIDSKDSFLACTNISFDVSIWEIFLPLLNGSKLVLYEEEIIQNIITYTESIVKNNITGLYIPPNILEDTFNILKDKQNVQINKLLVGVEPIRREVLNKYYNLNKDLIIVNGYGPTETTICCTAHICQKNDKDIIVSIGKPLYNNNIYILGSDLTIKPIGIPGEIYVTGAGVGKGYINNKTETDKNFLENQFDAESTTMYKTGDIAKWNEDGTICFIGRNDSQIKVSGHRIELGEINHTIMEYPNIIKSYTTTYKKGDKTYIVVYYIAEKEIPMTDLSSFLKNKVADYMIPNFMMQLQQFPLTPNGKINKEELPINFGLKSKYIEPRNEFEESLAKIFKKLFILKKVGIDDNFFDLGGDSLTAIKFQVEALNLDLKLTYSDIFSYPTIRMLSENKNKRINFNVNKNYDYSKINEIISKNNVSQIDQSNGNKTINNVLLIGATGFLGAHILEQLILNNANKIYCIVREKSSIEPEIRLRKSMEFYFGDIYNKFLGNKIIVIDGDITDSKLGQKNNKEYEELAKSIDCVIHTAAIVKHYGNFKNFNDTNVEGTINVINFCKKYNKKLYYISTLSVSGNIMKKNEKEDNIFFKENQFYIGQDLNNVYIYTKFEAEKKIFESMQDGLNACILRIGNITNRYSDGKFQINVSENAFINRLKSIINLGIVQEKFLKHYLEFTPVDCCAESIVKIVQANPKFTVFHLFNDNLININLLIEILHNLNIKITPVSDNEFSNKINLVLKDNNLKNEITGILTDLTENKLLNLINYVIPNSYFTQCYLKTLNFEWPIIDQEYIKKYIEYFKNIKYI